MFAMSKDSQMKKSAQCSYLNIYFHVEMNMNEKHLKVEKKIFSFFSMLK